VDKLRRAFESVRSLTSADAPGLAKDAYGILVKSLSAAEAPVLKQALENEGILTELVPDKLLPPLPPTRFVRRFEFGDDALLVQDPLGRIVPVEYRHLLILATGEVEVLEFQRRGGSAYGVPTYQTTSPLRLEMEELERPFDARQREVRARRHFVEILLARGQARMTLEVDANAHLLFEALGERRTQDLTRNLAQLVNAIGTRAPRLLMNRGSFLLRQEPPTCFLYPTRNAFYEEITWMLWQAAKNNYGDSTA